MFHDDIQCFAFAVHIFNEAYFSTADHTFGFHPVTAGYFGMLKYQLMVCAESDAYVIVTLQHINAASCWSGMQINHPFLITKVHGYYIWISLLIGDTDKADITAGDNFFYPLLVFYDDCFHTYKVIM